MSDLLLVAQRVRIWYSFRSLKLVAPELTSCTELNRFGIKCYQLLLFCEERIWEQRVYLLRTRRRAQAERVSAATIRECTNQCAGARGGRLRVFTPTATRPHASRRGTPPSRVCCAAEKYSAERATSMLPAPSATPNQVREPPGDAPPVRAGTAPALKAGSSSGNGRIGTAYCAGAIKGPWPVAFGWGNRDERGAGERCLWGGVEARLGIRVAPSLFAASSSSERERDERKLV
ncbi:hypothetical protein B0H17DRAFT_1129145 [Mycena rosella]|uniref:Uncharacterized protein n=1 Tax=Mycena rosella TaxID=1033263 RepID=A0AAD7DWB9_MYCRO|nr:hypothetical protein B0H17DRAFT_1129145 [Mycena rosella]